MKAPSHRKAYSPLFSFTSQAGCENPSISLHVIGLNGPTHDLEMMPPDDPRMRSASFSVTLTKHEMNVHLHGLSRFILLLILTSKEKVTLSKAFVAASWFSFLQRNVIQNSSVVYTLMMSSRRSAGAGLLWKGHVRPAARPPGGPLSAHRCWMEYVRGAQCSRPQENRVIRCSVNGAPLKSVSLEHYSTLLALRTGGES